MQTISIPINRVLTCIFISFSSRDMWVSMNTILWKLSGGHDGEKTTIDKQKRTKILWALLCIYTGDQGSNKYWKSFLSVVKKNKSFLKSSWTAISTFKSG